MHTSYRSSTPGFNPDLSPPKLPKENLEIQLDQVLARSRRLIDGLLELKNDEGATLAGTFAERLMSTVDGSLAEWQSFIRNLKDSSSGYDSIVAERALVRLRRALSSPDVDSADQLKEASLPISPALRAWNHFAKILTTYVEHANWQGQDGRVVSLGLLYVLKEQIEAEAIKARSLVGRKDLSSLGESEDTSVPVGLMAAAQSADINSLDTSVPLANFATRQFRIPTGECLLYYSQDGSHFGAVYNDALLPRHFIWDLEDNSFYTEDLESPALGALGETPASVCSDGREVRMGHKPGVFSLVPLLPTQARPTVLNCNRALGVDASAATLRADSHWTTFCAFQNKQLSVLLPESKRILSGEAVSWGPFSTTSKIVDATPLEHHYETRKSANVVVLTESGSLSVFSVTKRGMTDACPPIALPIEGQRASIQCRADGSRIVVSFYNRDHDRSIPERIVVVEHAESTLRVARTIHLNDPRLQECTHFAANPELSKFAIADPHGAVNVYSLLKDPKVNTETPAPLLQIPPEDQGEHITMLSWASAARICTVTKSDVLEYHVARVHELVNALQAHHLPIVG